MRTILFILLLLAGRIQAQVWKQVDKLHFGVTSISFDLVGNRFCSLQQGPLVENHDTMQIYDVLFHGESGFLNVQRSGNCVYLYIISPDTVARVLRYESAAQFPDTLIEVKYIDPGFTPPYNGNHVGGGLVVVGDTVLYASFGVGVNDMNAQDESTLKGKVVAYDLIHDAMWIIGKGFRNPFRIDYNAEFNEIWVADVGEVSAEEVNGIPLDGFLYDYGWPYSEGIVVNGNAPANYEFVPPIYWYTYPSPRAIIGGAYMDLNYYWGDAYSGFGGIIDENLENTTITTPGTETNPLTDMAVFDDKLYATVWNGQIYQYIPDTTVLALPEDTIIHDSYFPHKDDSYYREMLEGYGMIYIAVDGKVFGARPTVPGAYLKVIQDKNGVIFKTWIFIDGQH